MNNDYENTTIQEEGSFIESKVVPPVDILPSRSKTESPAGCQNINNSTISQTIPIRLVSATYGPCDGRRLINGEWSNTEAVRIPYTRDVLPFLKTLLLQAQGNHQNSKKKNEKLIKCESANDVLMMENKEQENMNCMVSISNNSISGATTKSSSTPLGLHTPVPLIMEGKSMNAVFGDPCPGTTKLLRVQYYFGDSISSKEEDETNPANRRKRKKGQELCRATFFEHEEVVLKRKMTFFQKDVKTLKHEEDQERNNEKDDDSLSSHEDAFDSREACKPNLSSSSPILKSISRNYRSQSITEFEIEEQEEILMKSQLDKNKVHDNLDPNNLQSSPPRNMSPISTPLALSKNTSPPQPKKWRLRSATSEIVLPMILPYLPLLQRAQCQLVCKVWRFIVREWGVAQVVDVKRCHAHLTSTTSSSSNTADPTNNSTGQNRSIVTHDPIRSFLRGVISNSYSSLQSLFLNDYHQLTREDFHPLIPHLKKLKRLDISRCKHLNNYTLILISQHLNKTLEMLYMKGLPNASDVGVKAMVSACTKLRVLEISNVKITDTSAFAIGNHLTNLQALYMRDNWRLTSEGVNCITERCHNLTQLTLWGTVKMKSMGTFANMEGLVLLNLWGCHGLRDDCVANFGGLKCLRSLIVSECHGLTDRFVVELAHLLPHINHLHLRYLRHLTDASINAIACSMDCIYSLDMSFCSKITANALSNLIETRGCTSLTEIKLYHCTQLDLRATYDIATAIANGGDRCVLSLLDWRKAGVHGNNNHRNNNEVVTVFGGRRIVREDVKQILRRIKFEEKIEGFWVRPTKWNEEMSDRFVENMAR